MSESSESPRAAEGARGSVETVELSAAQQSFARRVAESKATVPHVYFEQPHAGTPGLPALVAASARALREVPLLNGAYRDGRLELHSRVNVAVGIEADGTLLFPVIHDADRKAREAIATEIEGLAEQALGGSLTSPALAGATFTVIDVSGSGVARFVPVVNRGQAATLGAGTAWLTLACDNRIVQGTEGATLLGSVVAELDAS